MESKISKIFCPLAARCSGCDDTTLDRESHYFLRIRELQSLGLVDTDQSIPSSQVEHVWVQAGRLRDRTEFVLDRTGETVCFGVFAKSGIGEARAILDLPNCPQLSPALEDFLHQLRRDLPPVTKRGTIRFRVSPNGLRGLWLDFANEDLRNLLDEKLWLERWLDRQVVIEVGQRRKRVVRIESTLADSSRLHRLIDPILEPWFETWLDATTPTPLFCTVGSFTQPGLIANQRLVETVRNHLSTLQASKSISTVAEFGSGIGNFTLPILKQLNSSIFKPPLEVYESDALSLEGLKRGLEAAGLDARQVQIHQGDFIQSNKHKITTDLDLVVVDPPRPGLGRFADRYIEYFTTETENRMPTSWIYVSCFPESFAKDTKKLGALGLKITKLSVVEQFPYTKHFELVATLSS